MSIRMHAKRTVTRPHRERQAEALTYIRRCVEATGKMPTKNGLARALGMRSPSSAREMLERLTISGHLRRVNSTIDGDDGIRRYGWQYELTEKR